MCLIELTRINFSFRDHVFNGNLQYLRLNLGLNLSFEMNFQIRQENLTDYKAVFKLIKEAFEDEPFSDHTEHLLVEKLRESKNFIPELSLVAEFNGQIVGHILLTKIKIVNKLNQWDSCALAPVSVLPEFQKRGIGDGLIQEAHKKAKEIGFQSVVLAGHANYYPRFGYRRADEFDINLPFEIPKENCMVKELIENGLKGVSGTVEYPEEFYAL